ncbi:transcriptional regulator with PAS, ATPase and Fis domain [Clostridium saccharoperbutylacetonicum]|uniref:Acetoacetate metabolism regulatory protein AtoC n=1 Tax=Clostridium saccharoperbutylacetonicum N1-4(HMT) TaxID=931276 RepID=M1LSD9_9CLOT|nr:sigma 54-interacting transcriptional regulator [Clostridium saccharoperbutylacetonicum]AGF55880.1 acetoacetate metabolism regulatory protein AtoC [Clostridium saccharoperbutylacetonicum N1-4(HMT)]NRT63383.1 transcriptional regulator with PAS, ATPase and Fis domain [Clostridium saccharoperbutylacetonicum]NSB26745.1 transcriptional regulator with PAS, ATPase and Fis domain [Clostridium saccharoperbutylacetonicum]NSB46097.1 transcriptional regulator with PAS, ATPase and Fis domain [Clostridium 
MKKIETVEKSNELESNLKSLINILNSQNEVKIVEEDLYYNTAKNFGSRLNITDYDMLITKVSELGIGNARINLISYEKIVIQLYECFTCKDMKYTGKPVCFFEGGLLAGAVSTICGQDMDAIEVCCNTLGDSYCEFELTKSHILSNISNENSELIKRDNNILNLTLHSLKLVQNYNKIEHTSTQICNLNKQLNKSLETALEINNFNETILDSMTNCLALIDRNGVIIKINKQYKDFFNIDSYNIEKKSIKFLGWTTKYEEVLSSGNPTIWQETINGNHYIIFESPVDESRGVLHQLIPLESDFIKLLLDKISFLEKEMKYYKYKAMELKSESDDSDLISNSDKMKEIRVYINKVSKTDATVLLRGESGTGKSRFAKVIHSESLRRNKPFIYIDCTTIPKGFFESELFGYEDGAFTGAKKNGKAGKLESADGGTVFLDEIADIPLEIQSKLLRLLQEKEFERVGGITTKKLDIRIISATNQNLEKMVSMGTFRKDLYYRLNVINITLPSLRDRFEEIPSLVTKILSDFCQEVNLDIKEVEEDGMAQLIHYNWPGNIRELENLVKRLAINSDTNKITKKDIIKELNSIKNLNVSTINSSEDINIVEKELIVNTLKKYDYNKTIAAQALGITRQTLYNKMKRYSIDA